MPTVPTWQTVVQLQIQSQRQREIGFDTTNSKMPNQMLDRSRD